MSVLLASLGYRATDPGWKEIPPWLLAAHPLGSRQSQRALLDSSLARDDPSASRVSVYYEGLGGLELC